MRSCVAGKDVIFSVFSLQAAHPISHPMVEGVSFFHHSFPFFLNVLACFLFFESKVCEIDFPTFFLFVLLHLLIYVIRRAQRCCWCMISIPLQPFCAFLVPLCNKHTRSKPFHFPPFFPFFWESKVCKPIPLLVGFFFFFFFIFLVVTSKVAKQDSPIRRDT